MSKRRSRDRTGSPPIYQVNQLFVGVGDRLGKLLRPVGICIQTRSQPLMSMFSMFAVIDERLQPTQSK